MSDDLKVCIRCGAQNALSSWTCYACGRALPQDRSKDEEVEEEKEEKVEVELSVCDICRSIGRDRSSIGSRCFGCQHNPHNTRDIGCGCVIILFLAIFIGILKAISFS